MASKPLPSPEVLRQLLRYEPETGKLFWKERGVEWFNHIRQKNRWNTRYAGKEAFTANNGQGYRCGAILDHKCKAHRVIWLMVYGKPPSHEIDHINGDGMDNRLSNLREATDAENMSNRGVPSHNTSGFKGVSWHKRIRKWSSSIRHNRKDRHLGYFETPEEAHAAYCDAAERLHGEFARTA